MPTDQSREIKAVERTTGFEPASLDWHKPACCQLQHVRITCRTMLVFTSLNNLMGLKCGEFTTEEKQKDPVINRVLLLANPA